MNGNSSDRESQVAWRLTQLAILAFITMLVFAITDSNSNEVSTQMPDTSLNNQTELPDNPSTTSSEPESITSSTLQSDQNVRSFTFIATGELLIHEFVADAADSYGSIGFDFSPMFSGGANR